MKELRACCEFCEFYNYDYNEKCLYCRRDYAEPTDFSYFEIAKELIEWKESEDKL